MGHLFGHVRPARISHVVDVAVAAVDIATAGSLYENSVNFNHIQFPAGRYD